MQRSVAPAVVVFFLLLGQPVWAETEVRVSSELWPDETAALDEANRRLCDKLLVVVAIRASDGLSREELRRHLPGLLNAGEVRRDEFTEKVGKPYGLMFRQHTSVSVPDEVVAQWLADAVRERQARLHQRLGAGMMTLLGWLGGFWAVIKLDRWTNGYRRGAILSTTLGVLLALTGSLCVVLGT